jgi:hypothetical protein
MKRFLHWRKMTWAILLGCVAMVVGIVGAGFSPLVIVLSALGVIALCVTWFQSRPLWRVGHGARLRPLRSTPVAFKSTERLAPSPR